MRVSKSGLAAAYTAMWRKPQGYAVITDPDKGKTEFNTMTCSHCNGLTHLRAGQSPTDIGGFCYTCQKPICAKCVGKGCDEIQRKLDRWEASYHARRSYGI